MMSLPQGGLHNCCSMAALFEMPLNEPGASNEGARSAERAAQGRYAAFTPDMRRPASGCGDRAFLRIVNPRSTLSNSRI
ncbi:MAG: hypothetical protein M3Q16_04390 [Pseudomonadota bacterium]|nr:hypothetical protein [Pseudomonadota bacterium]